MRRTACSAGLLTLILLSADFQVKAAMPTDEEKNAFAWFDGLGLVHLKGAQWVRVATGSWSQRGGQPRENTFVDGFLLNADGDRFTVFTTSASTLTFVKTAKETPEYERVGYEARNLEEDAQARLESLRHSPADEREQVWQRFGERLSQRAEVFIIARACSANGLKDLAHDLCVQAEELPDRNAGAKAAPFLSRLQEDFAYSTIWKDFLQFEDPAIPRSELLKTFQDFLNHFPETKYTSRAIATADILDKMVEEDKAHAKATTRPIGEMAVADRVAELIFQLRDQNGHQWSQPGACDIFNDERGEKSPASQLVAIGFEAVPQLIDVLNDDRFTRSVGYHRDFYFSHYVLRVGDCAAAILSRIACRPFYVRRTTSGAMLKDGQADNVKREVQQWWAEVQTKGEKQALVDAVASGDENAMGQADRLVKKYPDAALDAISRGVATTKSDWLRVRLVQLSGDLPGDSALPLLMREMTKGETVDVRVAAANTLRSRGKAEATAAMIEEWNKECDGMEGRDKEAPESLIQFLASSDDPAAIAAMKARIAVWPVSSRLAIVESLGQRENLMVTSSGPGLNLRAATDSKGKQAALDAIEDLLVAQLQDTEERAGMTGSIGDDSFTDPRICDMAAHSLAARWKDLYSFRMSAPLPERNRQLVAIQNSWRGRHNLAPLPMPQSRKIDPVAREKTDPLLALLGSTDEAVRSKAAADIEALGLGALPAVRAAIAALPADDSRRSALEPLARRISCRVDQVEVPADVQLEGELKSALDDLKGTALTSQSFTRVLMAFARKQPRGIRGMKLYATRDDDHTGVAIRVQVVTGRFSDQSQWDTALRVTAGSEDLLGSWGGSSSDYVTTPDGWKDLAHAIDKALASPPQTPFEVHVSMERK